LRRVYNNTLPLPPLFRGEAITKKELLIVEICPIALVSLLKRRVREV